jgi:hypothetical protein
LFDRFFIQLFVKKVSTLVVKFQLRCIS